MSSELLVVSRIVGNYSLPTTYWYRVRYLSPILMSRLPFHRYLAELIGTYLLAQAISYAALSGAIPVPLAAGLTLGILVYVIGPISGAHVNPAVTIALASLKKISVTDAIAYLIAQFLGAGVVILKSQYLLGQTFTAPASPATLTAYGPLFGEACGTMILLLAVAAVVHKRVDAPASGLAIGGALTVGVVSAALFSNGVLNPAVALAVGSFSWMYVAGPIIGGLVGAWVYRLLHGMELKRVVA